MMTFNELMTRWRWKPIRNCPGRYILCAAAELSPRDLLGLDVEVSLFQVKAARDTVAVAAFRDGGLISYKRADGTYLHTLNTVEGFERKLSGLGIELQRKQSS